MNTTTQTFWRRCGSCKKEIPHNATYQACGVSGCQKFAYCSIDCWSLHNSILNHKSGWCEDRVAPKSEENEKRKILVSPINSQNTSSASSNSDRSTSALDEEILIVASKLKQYVKDKHDLNTSADVMEALSAIVRKVTDQAVIRAKSDNRKTLMKRDF